MKIIFSIPISDTDFNIGPQLFLSILSLIDWENFTKSFKEVTTLKLLDNLSTISYCFFNLSNSKASLIAFFCFYVSFLYFDFNVLFS